MYTIENVSVYAQEQAEQLGTKYKFWYRDKSGEHYLFKEGRPGTGENWAEKVCCELCGLLEIPHSHYELAVWKGRKGVITKSFVPNNGRLIFGNELLSHFVEGYKGERRERAHKHTLSRVMALMCAGGDVIKMPIGYSPPPEIISVAGLFIGYLMMDALVGNQDRHDENWGLILSPDERITLAPTFDHASSLGRNEHDNVRKEVLTTKDAGRSLERYVERARSAFYSRTQKKPLSTLKAFVDAVRRPEERRAKAYWLTQLEALKVNDFHKILTNIPPSEISDLAINFACKMLEINRDRLLNC